MNGADDLFDPEPERAETRDEWLGLKQGAEEDRDADMAELARLRAVVAAVEAIVDEWANDNMIVSPDSKFTRDVLVLEARAALRTAS